MKKDSVRVAGDDFDAVATLRASVVAKWRYTLAHVAAEELTVYESRDAFDRGDPPLDADADICAFGGEKATALCVVVPRKAASQVEHVPLLISSNVVVYGSLLGSGDGVDLENGRETLRRSATTKRIINQLDKERVLMLTGSPMSGKTSLSAQVCHDLKKRSLARVERVAIAIFSMIDILEGETIFNAFKRKCSIAWNEVLAMADNGYTVYFVLDEIQTIYQTSNSPPSEESFEVWRLIKCIFTSTDRRVHVLMFANYYVGAQYAGLGSLVQLPEDQVLGVDQLNFGPEEIHDYVAKCFAGYDSLETSTLQFCALLEVLTGGHVGFCVTVVRALNEVYRSQSRRCASAPSAREWLEMLQSGKLDGTEHALCTRLEATRAVEIFKRLWGDACAPLGRLLCGVHSEEDEVVLDRCVHEGVLERRWSQFDFSSSVLWRYFARICLARVPRAVDDPTTLGELIVRCVRAINYDAIRKTLYRRSSSRTRIALERAWQLQFHSAVHRCTSVAFQTSVGAGALFGSPGFLELTVRSESVCWGIEWVREADRMDEHIARFAPGGLYSGLHLTDYCLVDFRCVRSADSCRRQAIAATPSASPKLFVAWHDEALTHVALNHGDSTLTILESAPLRTYTCAGFS